MAVIVFTKKPLCVWSITNFTNNSFNVCYTKKPVFPLILQIRNLRYQEINCDCQVGWLQGLCPVQLVTQDLVFRQAPSLVYCFAVAILKLLNHIYIYIYISFWFFLHWVPPNKQPVMPFLHCTWQTVEFKLKLGGYSFL